MRGTIAAVFCLLVTSPLHASLPKAAQEVFAELESVRAPGCAVGIMQAGKLIEAEGFGYADLEGGQRITPDTIFNVASVSKHFTAFAILQLEGAGKLKLGDSVRRYVPELPEYAEPVTLRHLLHHTGGLRDFIILAEMKGVTLKDRLTQRDALSILARQPRADFPPGSEHVYSNTGYFLLSVVVERVTGQSMRHYSEQNIFAPLGMKNTSFVDSYPTRLPTLARGYILDDGTYKIHESGWEVTGDGQVHTTVRDLALWEENLISGRVGGKSLVRRMTEQGRLNNGRRLIYAMGLNVRRYRGTELVDHSGHWVGYTAYFARFPREKFAVSVLCNRDLNPTERARRVADVYLSNRLEPARPASVSPTAFVKRHASEQAENVSTGIYANEKWDILEVTRTSNTTIMETPDFEGELRSANDGAYAIQDHDTRIFVSFPDPDHIAVDNNPYLFRRLPPFTPTDIDHHVGIYQDIQSDAEISIIRREGALAATIGGDSYGILPISGDRLWIKNLGVMQFNDDDGIMLHSSAIRGLIFKRK